MALIEGFLEVQKYDFSDTSFNLLMQTRIHKVLLVSSNYDAYMLEEDGRIDEQIFNEYVSLNLRYPPTFIQVDTAGKAFRTLEDENIDLIILMMRVGTVDTFELAKQLKEKYPDIPIVVLTNFSREVSVRLEKEDLSGIDYVFCWLGNADLLLAIIKLIEDKMNAEYDIERIGVQAILLVEDSIRYVSTYLPNLYKIILQQSHEFQHEALNEHQQMLRLRGRPKILLATTYEEAMALYEKYKYNLLGVISDINYKREGVKDPKAGISLCEKVKIEDPNVPFLLQSSNLRFKEVADTLNAGFIHKYSKSLSIELRNFIIKNLAFGPFIFRDPDSLKEIDRANDLQEFQQKLLTLPDNSLEYHTSRNDFSKWLNARALFPIAQMFKYLQREDFDSLDEIRRFIYVAISSFRFGKGRGIIAKFDKSSFDEYLIFSRIGDGSIGGKARGLAFINTMIKKHGLFNRFQDVIITIPRTVVLSTDVFDEFMEKNDLYKIGLSDMDDKQILDRFVKAELPAWVCKDILAFLEVSRFNPIAVRSSSKLEDSHYQPFAGIYSTYMIPRTPDNKMMVGHISSAIKEVYASVYYKSSKAYMTATSNVIDEEKMGIILQEVCGNKHEHSFYPTFSGVARSINFYPIGQEKPQDGIVSIALGLGKYIVDGGITLRFSPRYPKKILQLSSPKMALRDTQKNFYALDLDLTHFVPSTDDGVNILKLKLADAEKDNVLRHVASTYDLHNNIIRDGIHESGKRIVTFTNILTHNVFPLAEILRNLLEMGQQEMNNPIEIEFAVNLGTPPGTPRIFNFLQIRPIVDTDQKSNIKLEDVKQDDALIISYSALGNGIFTDISDFVYVKPESFSASHNKKIAVNIEKINEQFTLEKKNYILVGPGRWGSTDPWLGIPTNWPQISQARVIVEAGLKDYRIDPSQGTHFFQNLTSFRVGYFTINPYMNDGYYDLDFLNRQEALFEDEFIRHIRFHEPLRILVDGKTTKGVIFKPCTPQEK